MHRSIFLTVILISLASFAQGQTPFDPGLPEPCRVEISEDLPALEKRKQQLELELSLQTTDEPALRKNAERIVEDNLST